MEQGDLVNLYLIDPIEKMWGRLVRIDVTGIILRGIDVSMIEPFRYQLRKEETVVYPQTSFWPMRRVQRMDLDEPMDELPSVIQSIMSSTGFSADEIISLPEHPRAH